MHTVLRPYLLRRLKGDVENSIPPKEEVLVEVELTSLQKKYYRAILERNREFLYKGCSAGNVPNLINVVMQLRKVCNHPYLIKVECDLSISPSLKCFFPIIGSRRKGDSQYEDTGGILSHVHSEHRKARSVGQTPSQAESWRSQG